MVGREVTSLYRREAIAPGEELLRVKDLKRAPLVNGVSFSAARRRSGGDGGLDGRRADGMCRIIFGVDPMDSGEVYVAGRQLKIRNRAMRCAPGSL